MIIGSGREPPHILKPQPLAGFRLSRIVEADSCEFACMLRVRRQVTFARTEHTATTARIKNMKKLLKPLAVAGMAVLGFVASATGQVQQSISFSLTVYNQTDTGIRALRLSNRDIIANLVGTNVPGGRLLLVMPNDPSPDGSGNIGAFLRVTDSKGNVIVDTTSDYFNIYLLSSSRVATRTYAWNQFSLAFGGIGAEVYGMALWSKSSRGPGGLGSFHCSVSGHCTLSGVTDGDKPCVGSISGGSPRPAG